MRWSRDGALLLLLIVAVPCAAQTTDAHTDPPRPRGWWGGFEAGFSAIRFACEDCPEDQPAQAAPFVQVSVGRSIGSSVGLGLEVSLTRPGNGGDRLLATTVAGAARWYPTQAGAFVKIGIGLARARLRLASHVTSDDSLENGVGISIGVGYDLHVGRRMAITPIANWFICAVGDVVVPDRRIRSVSWNNWSVGAGLTFF